MIRAKLSNGDLLFGIDAENVRRLTGAYGKTMADIQADLERVSGAPLPPATPYIPGPGEAQ
jgi:hypothetical protein